MFHGAAATAGSTGTSATTNANDTSAASGTTTVVGTLAKTNANDTSAATGTTTIIGTLARTNANDTATASGTVGSSGSSGSAATTNANDASAASGTTTIKGTAAVTNANDTASASGSGGTSVAGGSYDEPKKRRFVQKVGNKFLVFDSATKAAKALDAEIEAKAVDAVVEDGEAPVAPPEPDEVVPIAAVRAQAVMFDQQRKLNDLFTSKDYDAIVALYEQLVQQQDEEDIELLLTIM
jgi:hypothetical protein